MATTKEVKYEVKRQTFFKWYFDEQNKEQISAFIAPYLLGLVNKPAEFSLEDILVSVAVIPTKLVEGYTGKINKITTDKVKLIK